MIFGIIGYHVIDGGKRMSNKEQRLGDMNTNDETFYYTEQELQDLLRKKNVHLNDLSLGDLLASERTNLANKRNVYALKRTLQAAERTYSAWLRTGFSIVSAGVAFAGLLGQTSADVFSTVIGGLLISVGLMAFIYAWFQYFETYKWLRKIATKEQQDGAPVKTDLAIITIITIMLLGTSVTAFALVLFG